MKISSVWNPKAPHNVLNDKLYQGCRDREKTLKEGVKDGTVET